MNYAPRGEPASVVRAHAGIAEGVRLHSRKHAWVSDGQHRWEPDRPHPSALDYLLGALASDLAAGLGREARRAGVFLEAVELNLEAHLENPLAALGVNGEDGSPALAAIRGSCYVSSDAPEATVLELWNTALRRAPVYATLARSASVDIALQFVS